MTATNSAAPTQSIVVDYDLPEPPAKIWRALTEPELLAAWLMPNDFKPELGHKFTFQTKPMPGWDGVVQCEVLAIEPETRLRYSWRGGSAQMRLDTVVTWTLRPSESGGTHLHLEHAGFTAKDAFALDGLGRGWRGNVAERMAALLATLA